jgi:hypothetical protein
MYQSVLSPNHPTLLQNTGTSVACRDAYILPANHKFIIPSAPVVSPIKGDCPSLLPNYIPMHSSRASLILNHHRCNLIHVPYSVRSDILQALPSEERDAAIFLFILTKQLWYKNGKRSFHGDTLQS